jgi:spore germination protein (amino acid permease)
VTLEKSSGGMKMKRIKSDNITSGELTFMLIGSMIGIGILSLPNSLITKAKQDSWISAAVGALYPLYMVLAAVIIYKKSPHNNILVLSKKCFGKIIGTILNVIFLCFFIFNVSTLSAGLSIILRTLIVSFISSIKILILIVFLAAFTAYKGLKVLSRVNQLTFYYTTILIIILFAALAKGNYLNICPILGSGLINILKASKSSAFAYGGIEILFLIYPLVTDSSEKIILKSSLLGVFITCVFYTWAVFITIYFLGIDNIPRAEWSVSLTTRSVYIPVINNFRFVFLILWAAIIFKTISNNYYAVALIINSFFKKAQNKIIICIIFPMMVYLSAIPKNNAVMAALLDYFIPKFTLFNIIYVTLIAVILYIKKAD